MKILRFEWDVYFPKYFRKFLEKKLSCISPPESPVPDPMTAPCRRAPSTRPMPRCPRTRRPRSVGLDPRPYCCPPSEGGLEQPTRLIPKKMNHPPPKRNKLPSPTNVPRPDRCFSTQMVSGPLVSFYRREGTPRCIIR